MTNYSTEPSLSPFQLSSWADRNGFAHWGLAAIWMVFALIGFQLVGGLVFLGLMFLTGRFSNISGVEDVITSNLDLLFWGNTTGQLFIIGLATFFIVRLHVAGEGRRTFLRIQWFEQLPVKSVLAALAIVAIQPVVIYMGYLNSLIPLPDFALSATESQYELIENFLKMDGMILFGLFHIAFIPAICEEVLFRGYILRALEKSWGIIAAIILSSLLFGIFHLQLNNLLPLATLGVLLAVVTWKSGSIIPAIAAHFINNGTAVVLANHYPELAFGDISAESLPPFWMFLASSVITVLILYPLFINNK